MSVQAVHDFLKIFVAPSESDDDILPKNGAFSPFYGFSRIYPQHTNLQDGGTSLDGISRAGVNKVVGRLYQEGMRKPSRNGNPGDLIMADAHKLARHFLKLRWRNPDQAADLVVLQQAWNEMQPQQVVESVRVLRLLCQWKPGPAGRGGDRGSRRSAAMEMESDESNVRRKMSDGSAQRIIKTCTDAEDDTDDLSDRSTVVGSDISPRAHNTNRPDPLSASLPLRAAADHHTSGWASALAATPYACSLSGSSGSGVARSAGPPDASSSSSSALNNRLSSQGLLLQLAQQVRHHAANTSSSSSSAPSHQQHNTSSISSSNIKGPMTAAQFLCSSHWGSQPPSNSFASTLLSPSSSAPALASAPPASEMLARAQQQQQQQSQQKQQQQQQQERRKGDRLTLPPLSISTALPPLSQVLEQAFA